MPHFAIYSTSGYVGRHTGNTSECAALIRDSDIIDPQSAPHRAVECHRDLREMTRSEVCTKFNVTPQTVRRWIGGRDGKPPVIEPRMHYTHIVRGRALGVFTVEGVERIRELVRYPSATRRPLPVDV